MSLSVLVGQPVHWEGTGKSRHQVVTPPTPETMKTIRDLVAGVTGLDATRGDQLIVETLPFESNLTADMLPSTPSALPKSTPEPAWMGLIEKYKNIVFMAVGGLVVLAALAGIVRRSLSRRSSGVVKAERGSGELEAAAALRQTAAQRASVASADPGTQAVAAEARRLLAEAHAETAERIRQMAQREPVASANVLRMWIHDQNT